MRAIIAIIAALTCSSAMAQDWPSRPVTLVNPFAVASAVDVVARLAAQRMTQTLGRSFLVENRTGASGNIGTEFAARSDPNGYTLYLATDGPLTVAATLHKKVPYDWKRDFAPVSMMAVGYQIMLGSPKVPANNLKEFVALAKQEPGKFNYASIGIGSAPHLSAEQFLATAELKLTHVPYRGSSAQAITALIAGDVAMFIVGTSTAVPFVKAGTVRGIAVTSPKRLDSLPDTPAFTELGWPNVDYSIWFAVLAPGGTPPAIVRKLNADIAKVVADPDYKKTLDSRGFEAQSNTPEQMAAFLEKDYQKFKVVIEKLGLKVE